MTDLCRPGGRKSRNTILNEIDSTRRYPTGTLGSKCIIAIDRGGGCHRLEEWRLENRVVDVLQQLAATGVQS